MEPEIQNSQLIFLPNLEIQVWSADTLEMVDVVRSRNRVLKVGRNRIRDMLGWPQFESVGYTPDFIEIGSNATAVSDTQTGVITPVYSKQITRKIPGTSLITYQLYVDSSEGNGNNFREAGLNAFSASRCFARAVFSTIAKTSSISLVFNWTITLASA